MIHRQSVRSLNWSSLLLAGLFLIATIMMPIIGAQITHAAAGEAVWTGAAGDNKFSTAGNWQGNTLPVTGNKLVFATPAANGSDNSYVSITNDLPSTTLFSGYKIDNTAEIQGRSWNVTGLTRFQSNPTFEKTGSVYWAVAFEGGINVAGDLTINKDSYTSPLSYGVTIAGVLTLDGTTGTMSPYGAYASSYSGVTNLVMKGLATYNFSPEDDTHFPITIESGATAELGFQGECTVSGGVGQQCATYSPYTYEVTGALTNNGALSIYLADSVTANVPAQTGSGTIAGSVYSAPNSVLNIGGTAIVVEEKTTDLDGDELTGAGANVTVGNKETAHLNGSRQSVSVLEGGVLKGNGTTSVLSVSGIVAPGNSPGKLTVLNSFSLFGTYQAEIQNKDTYDQIIVGAETTNPSSAVYLNNTSMLNISLFDGWVINVGDTFTIIDNQATTAVDGTFKDLAEGAKVTIDNIDFSISYVGGDGNDVVLTALNSGKAPLVPNTGVLKFVKANPIVVAVLGLIAASAVVLLAKRRTALKR